MSVRFPPSIGTSGLSRCQSGEDSAGSLFGPPIEGSELWEKLAGSPIVRATTPSDAPSSLHFDRADPMDDVEMEMCELSLASDDSVLDSVVHLHELPADFAYSYFEREESETTPVRAPNGRMVPNANPVLPRAVHADAVVWHPTIAADGASGHRYSLELGGVAQARIEVFLEDESDGDAPIAHVFAVHGLYSHLAHAAKLVDQHSVLRFSSPQTHKASLYEMLSCIDRDTIYLPVNEIVVGSALAPTSASRLRVLVPAATSGHPHARHAARVWERATAELHALSTLVTNCANQHNLHEFTRTGRMYC